MTIDSGRFYQHAQVERFHNYVCNFVGPYAPLRVEKGTLVSVWTFEELRVYYTLQSRYFVLYRGRLF